MTTLFRSGSVLAAAALFTLLAAMPAQASDHGGAPAAPLLPAYQQECAACHLAFPPGLLPAPSWQRLMAGLPRHFGVDASLDAAAQKTLAAWLQANAGSHRKLRRETAPPPEDRITRAAWFLREHREVPAEAWPRPAIKSAAHCAACHPKADLGDFNERDVHIPR
jgi:hypothetical protein